MYTIVRLGEISVIAAAQLVRSVFGVQVVRFCRMVLYGWLRVQFFRMAQKGIDFSYIEDPYNSAFLFL